MPQINSRHTMSEPIGEILEKNYMPYAMSVIVSRAIPEIDGFKPAHRKLLYTMYKMNLLTSPRTKSANVVGQTMKLNPHGDDPIYETMVRLTRGNEALLYPYIDSKGNFGKQYSRDMQYAASRYTEVKLAKICQELFTSIDKEVIQMQANYDGTLQEPQLLPVRFPSILVNANQGIAVGMASNICSFNLKEVCAATIAYIKDKHVDLLPYLPAPDFPGGADLLYNADTMRQIYQNGRGSFKLRARYTYDKKSQVIEVFEIPYTTTVEAIIDDLSELIKQGKIKEILDVRDETDLGGLKLSIEVRKSVDPDLLMTKLYKLTSLESSFSCNFNILLDGRPQVLGIKGILEAWLQFRRRCFVRELSYDLKKLQHKLHLLLALEKILLDIDKAIAIIRETAKEEEVVSNLCLAFSIDEVQANYVADIRLRHLNQEYLLERLEEKEDLRKNIQACVDLLASEKKMDKQLIQQLEQIAKQYGQERRTQCIQEEDIVHATAEDLIEDYRLKLFCTKQGYLKKIPLTSLRSNPEIKTKEEDEICRIYEVNNKSELLVFSSYCACYKLQVQEIPDCKPSEWGEYLPSVLGFAKEEKVVFISPEQGYKGYFLFSFENGKVAKIPLQSYFTKTKRKKLVGAFSDKSPLVNVLYQAEGEEEQALYLQSNKQKVLVLSSQLISEKQSRSSQGIEVLTLRSKAKLERFEWLKNVNLAAPDTYWAKRIPLAGQLLKEYDVNERQLKL